MDTIYIANTLLKRGFFCVAALFLFFFMGCSANVKKPPAIPEGGTQQFIQLIRNSNPNAPFGITVDNSGDEPVIILTATNTVNSALELTVDINQEGGIITDPSSLTITANEPIVWGEETMNVMVTFSSVENAFPYKVKTIIEGTPIKDWMWDGTINDFMKANFAGEEGWISLGNFNTISIIGLRNANNASNGFISFTLPTGYIANPSIIPLPDPDGQGANEATIMPSPTTFSISEQGRSAITQIYSINPIQLEGLLDETQQLADLILKSNPDSAFEVTVDRTDFSLPVIVLTATNTVESALSATVTINQNEGIITDPSSFTITADNPIVREERTANIMATFDSAAQPISYPLTVLINAAPIETWMTDENIDTYVTATFDTQRGVLFLGNDNTLSIEGLTNVDNGAEGSISIELPAGFTADRSIIPLPDPDGEGINETTITPRPSTFTISESDKSANSQSYTINPIALSKVRIQRLVDLIERSNPDSAFSVSVDKSVDPPIIVLRATNTVESALSAIVAINQNEGIKTDPPSLTITADNPIVREERTTNIMATFDSESYAISYSIKTVIEGAPVEAWLTANTVSQYITATFNYQNATLLLDENTKTLSVTRLINIDNGDDGSINFTLPAGYTADPSSIALPDPDGTNQATITPSVTAFTISDDSKSANSQSYTLDAINLAELTGFDPSIHISAVDTTFTERPVENLIFSEENGVITVTGLTNALNVDKTYTFTISEIPGIFTIYGGNDIRFDITEPEGSSSGGASLSENTFTITNQGDNRGTTYSLIFRFSDGALIANWLDVNTFSTYFTRATFSGQVATTLTFDGSVIFISGGLTNLPSGSIEFTSQLPPGYTLVDALTDPDGDLLLDAVIEGDAGSITITEDRNPDNSESYLVKISLEPYIHSPVHEDDITVTNFFGTQSMDATVDITGNVITISSIFNTFGTEGRGSVVITPPMNSYTIALSDTFHFDNPDGTEAQTIALGTVIIETINDSVPHDIVLHLLTSIEITITDPDVINSPVSIFSGGTVSMASPCEILPLRSANVTVSGAPPGSMLDGNKGVYYDRAIDILSAGKYTITETLTIVDGSSAVIDSSFVINAEFLPCNDDSVVSTAFGIGRTGVDASTAYQINDAAKLELVSFLVETDNRTYGNKYYELTTDIDMDLGFLPWNEASGGAGFLPIGKNDGTNFSGTLDCNNNTISNLHINRPNTSNVGLFGYVKGATIKNCTLINVNVTGDTAVGGLVGQHYSGSTVENSSTTGSVSGTTNVGGLAGINSSGLIGVNYNTPSFIRDSYSEATVTGTGESAGGLVGQNYYRVTVENSYATGSVIGTDRVGGLIGKSVSYSTIIGSHATGSVTGNVEVGGLVGWNNDNSTVEDSYATGSVRGSGDVGGLIGRNVSSSQVSDSYAAGSVIGNDRVGGLIGWNNDNSTIARSYAEANVRGRNNVGGLVGQNSSSDIIRSTTRGATVRGGNHVGGLVGGSISSTINYASAGVTVIGNDRVGGLVGGSFSSTITISYTTGSVTGNVEVGGLIGYNRSSQVSDSYAAGSVTGNSHIGGLVGANTVSSTITRSYATGSVSGVENVGGLVGIQLRGASVKSSYATGNVRGSVDVGGLIGWLVSPLSFIGHNVINSYAIGNVTGQIDSTIKGLFIGKNSYVQTLKDMANDRYIPTYTNVLDSYFNTDAILIVEGAVSETPQGVGNDDIHDPSTTTDGLIGLATSDLKVVKGTTSGSIYNTWFDNVWDFTAGQYPRLKTVACANRQFNSNDAPCSGSLQ